MTMLYIAIAVLVLIFGFLSYLNFKTWNILQVIAAFCTFFAAFAFLMYAALVLKTHSNWHKHYVDLSTQVAKAEYDTEKLINGSALHPETGSRDTIDISLLEAKEEVERVMHARGRVWRNCQHGPLNNGSINVTLNLKTDPNDPNAAPPIPSIDPGRKAIVHVFGEIPGPQDDPLMTQTAGMPVPAFYVGEFIINGVNGPNLNLVPSNPDYALMQRLVNASPTWSIYDQMPIDNGQIFKELAANNQQLLGSMVANAFSIDPRLAQDRANVLSQLSRHDTKDVKPTDEKDSVWWKVKVLQDFTETVDLPDSGEQGQNYDPDGYATNPNLIQGKESEFKKGDIFDVFPEKADELVAEGKVEKVEQVYRRPLHDFAAEFYETHGRLLSLDDQFDEINRLKQDIEKANQEGEEIKAYREKEKAALEKDRDQVVFERDEAIKLRNQRAAQLEKILQVNSQLYRTNQAMLEELTQIHKKLTEEINRNSDSVSNTTSLKTAAR